MNTVNIAGLIFYVVINFISPTNNMTISQIRAYYQKEGIVIKVQGDDYYGDLFSEHNKEVGERWEEMREIHNILALGGWENIEYFEFESKPPVLVSIILNQKQTLYGINYYGIYFLKNSEKSFTEYRGIFYKDEVLSKLKRFCRYH